MLEPHGHKVCVRIWTKFCHEDPLGVTNPGGHFGTCRNKMEFTERIISQSRWEVLISRTRPRRRGKIS